MQTTSDLYKDLLSADARKEIRLLVAGEEYGEDRICSLSTTGSLFAEDTLCVGSAVSRQIDVVLTGYGEIPRMAELIPQYRLVDGNAASEWISKGVFYIDTRQEDKVAGTLTIHGFDAMLKGSVIWVPDQTLFFPMTFRTAAGVLATAMGVTLDNPEDINDSYQILDYPANDYTVRNVLQFIAAAHAANFIMTDEGRLRMVRINEIPPGGAVLVTEYGDAITFGGIRIQIGGAEENNVTGNGDAVFAGDRVATSAVSPAFDPISKVIVMVDDENAWVAGDDSGFVLKVQCPYGSQTMADNILTAVGGFVYRPFAAEDAIIDPAAELGDGVTVDGVYSVLAQQDVVFDALMAGRISAPGQKEVESEYSYKTKEQQMEYKIAQTRSLITKTAEEIRLEVTGLSGQVSSLSTTVNGFDARITAADGKAAEAALRLDGFTVTTYDEDGNVGTVTLKGGTVGSEQIKANVSIAAPTVIGGTVYGSTFILETPWYSDPTSLDGSAIHIVPEDQSSPFGSIYYRRITNPGETESAHNLYITTREWGGIASTEPPGSIKIRSGYRMSLEAQIAIYMNGGTQGIVYGGQVDFTNATVIGLDTSGSVAVFG